MRGAPLTLREPQGERSDGPRRQREKPAMRSSGVILTLAGSKTGPKSAPNAAMWPLARWMDDASSSA